jgi:hypothetical protein
MGLLSHYQLAEVSTEAHVMDADKAQNTVSQTKASPVAELIALASVSFDRPGCQNRVHFP